MCLYIVPFLILSWKMMAIASILNCFIHLFFSCFLGLTSTGTRILGDQSSVVEEVRLDHIQEHRDLWLPGRRGFHHRQHKTEQQHTTEYFSHRHHSYLTHFKDMCWLSQRSLQPSLLSHSLFSRIYSQYSRLTFISFLIWSIHLVRGLPLGRFPPISVSSIFLEFLSSSIRIPYHYHPNLLFWMSFFISSISSSNSLY